MHARTEQINDRRIGRPDGHRDPAGSRVRPDRIGQAGVGDAPRPGGPARPAPDPAPVRDPATAPSGTCLRRTTCRSWASSRAPIGRSLVRATTDWPPLRARRGQGDDAGRHHQADRDDPADGARQSPAASSVGDGLPDPFVPAGLQIPGPRCRSAPGHCWDGRSVVRSWPDPAQLWTRLPAWLPVHNSGCGRPRPQTSGPASIRRIRSSPSRTSPRPSVLDVISHRLPSGAAATVRSRP